MTHPVGLATDSNAQLPAALVERYDVGVVPITVAVDFEARPEHEWTADEIVDRLAAGATVSTSQPSPGEIAATWQALVECGAEEIVSMHIAAAYSGTMNAARIAMDLVDVPVRLVDTGQTSFGIGSCVWSAAEARADGGMVSDIVAAAERTAATLRNAFVMDGLDLAKATGRVGRIADRPAESVTVWSLVGNDLDALGGATDLDEAAEVMANAVLSEGRRVRVGVGVADRRLEGAGDALAKRLADAPEVVEIVRYRVGPSVMVASGPGSFGGYWFPV